MVKTGTDNPILAKTNRPILVFQSATYRRHPRQEPYVLTITSGAVWGLPEQSGSLLPPSMEIPLDGRLRDARHARLPDGPGAAALLPAVPEGARAPETQPPPLGLDAQPVRSGRSSFGTGGPHISPCRET